MPPRRSSVAIASVSRPWSAQRPGEHDPALGDERARRRRRGELLPQLLDPPVLAQRAGAVHQHRVLLDRVRQLDERLELLGRRRVLAEPVLAQAEQLAHRARVRVGVAQRAQQPGRVAFASGGERLGGAGELGLGVARRRDPAIRASSSPASVLRSLPAPRRRGGARLAAPDVGRGAVSAGGRRTLRSDDCALGARRRRLLVLAAELLRRVVDAAVRRIAIVAVLRRPLAIAAAPPLRFGAPRPVSLLRTVPPQLAPPGAVSARRRASARRPRCGGARRGDAVARAPSRLGAPSRLDVRFGAPSRPRRRASAPRPAGRALRRTRDSTSLRRTGCPGSDATAAPSPRVVRRAPSRGTRGALGPVARAARLAFGHSEIRFRGGTCSVREDARRKGRASSVLAKKPGDDLLSQEDYLQVPSARAVLTAVFGMGTGVSPPPWSPGSNVSSRATPKTP